MKKQTTFVCASCGAVRRYDTHAKPMCCRHEMRGLSNEASFAAGRIKSTSKRAKWAAAGCKWRRGRGKKKYIPVL